MTTISSHTGIFFPVYCDTIRVWKSFQRIYLGIQQGVHSLIQNSLQAATDSATSMQIFCPGLKDTNSNAAYHTVITPESAGKTEIESPPYQFLVTTFEWSSKINYQPRNVSQTCPYDNQKGKINADVITVQRPQRCWFYITKFLQRSSLSDAVLCIPHFQHLLFET